MRISSVINQNNYRLTSAGKDGLFNTSDDLSWNVIAGDYTGGLLAEYLIENGPLEPGRYMFSIKTNLSDKFLNPILTNYQKEFIVISLSGILYEKGNNNTTMGAVPLGYFTNFADGSFIIGSTNAINGTYPACIAVGYINNDTNIDILTANYTSTNISVLYGDGTGGISHIATFYVGDGPMSLSVLDVNSDNIDDIVVANYGGDKVNVLLGNGMGGFSNIVNYNLEGGLYWVKVVDVNGDSAKDIVTANYSGNSISILYGDGNGNFTNKLNFPATAGPMCIDTGDFNGDGKLDIAVSGYDGGNFAKLFNDGYGNFTMNGTFPVGGECPFLRVGDINVDAKPDIAALNVVRSKIEIYYGNGLGGFNYGGSAGEYLYYAMQFSLDDISNDGLLDIVVPCRYYDFVVIMPGKNYGTYERQHRNFIYYNYPLSSLTADFNSDGIKDIAVPGFNDNTVRILLGNAILAPYGDSYEVFSMVSARSNISHYMDYDYWSITGYEGENVLIAVESLYCPYASGLSYNLVYSSGYDAEYFYSDLYGIGQFSFRLPNSGRYYLAVSKYYNYQGELKFNIVKTPPYVQIEYENNDNITSANILSSRVTDSGSVSKVVGVIHLNDNMGDYYRIGKYSPGTSIKLSLFQPEKMKFPAIIELYDENEVLITNSNYDNPVLVYNVPEGDDETYYARVISIYPGFSSTSRHSYKLQNGYIEITDFSTIDFNTNNFTVETWLNVPFRSLNEYSSYVIISKSVDQYRSPGWAIELTAEGHYPFYIVKYYNTGQNIKGKTECKSKRLIPGQWYHIAGVRSDGVNYLYVNGNLEGINIDDECGLDVNNDNSIKIGFNWGAQFDGIIAEPSLWNKAI